MGSAAGDPGQQSEDAVVAPGPVATVETGQEMHESQKPAAPDIELAHSAQPSQRTQKYQAVGNDQELIAKLELKTRQLVTLQAVADENLATATAEHEKQVAALQAQLLSNTHRDSHVNDLEATVAALQAQLQTDTANDSHAKELEAQVHRLQSDLESKQGTYVALKADFEAEQDSHAALQAQASVDLESAKAVAQRLQEALQLEEDARSARLDEERSTGSVLETELADERNRNAALQSQIARMEENSRLAGQETARLNAELATANRVTTELKEELAAANATKNDTLEVLSAEKQRLTELAAANATANDSLELLSAEKQRLTDTLRQTHTEAAATAATISARRDGDQSAMRALQAEVDQLRTSNTESESAASAKIHRLQKRCDAQVDKHSAQIGKLKKQLKALKAEEKARLALEGEMVKLRATFETERLSADAVWQGQVANLKSDYEDQLAHSQAAHDTRVQNVQDSFASELKERDEQLAALKQSSGDQSELLDLANQRADQSAAATVETERSAARAATVAQSKLRELEDEIWRLRQAGAAVGAQPVDGATQAELADLRRKLAQSEAALRQAVDATPEQQADAIGQRLATAMGLHEDTAAKKDVERLNAMLQTVRKELAQVRDSASKEQMAHDEERSQSKMQISELTRMARQDANARLQVEEEAESLRRELARREDELVQLAGAQAQSTTTENKSNESDVEALLAQLADCRKEAAEEAATLAARLAIAEEEAQEATKKLQQCGSRELELETTLAGVEQMLEIKEEEIGELQTAHAADWALRQSEALALRRHDQDIRSKLEAQVRTVTAEAAMAQHKMGNAEAVATEECAQLRAQVHTSHARSERAEEMLSEAEAERSRLEHEAADSVKLLKSVVDQRKELTGRVADLEQEIAVAQQRVEAQSTSFAKDIESSRAAAESLRQELELVKAEAEAEKQLVEWEREWRKHEAEADIEAAEAEIAAQAATATRRCEAAEGRLGSLAAAKLAASADVTAVRIQLAEAEEATRIAEAARDAALTASQQRAVKNEAALVGLKQELTTCQAVIAQANENGRAANRRADEALAQVATTQEAGARLEWELSRSTVRLRESEDQLSIARRELQMLSSGAADTPRSSAGEQHYRADLRSRTSSSLSVVSVGNAGSPGGIEEAVPPYSSSNPSSPHTRVGHGVLAHSIRQLAELVDDDIITEDEFQRGKEELLQSLQPY